VNEKKNSEGLEPHWSKKAGLDWAGPDRSNFGEFSSKLPKHEGGEEGEVYMVVKGG